ncbi:hypothetical protein Psuf_080110 [Phytohabitans suffuscus]|uniref:Uncharacterized protein n=1 Tax=Phytohabitans suffuscus TaxID=624315 RepID=A0A6F8YXN1_9ACTN|nr:hypothetical protein [Phytohabitans suffuscus]BCB90698.1 hypothetical protein Psuf_080110 [Phytohabitans suffuscus]
MAGGGRQHPGRCRATDPGNPAQPVADAFLADAYDAELAEVPLLPHAGDLPCPRITPAVLDRYPAHFAGTGWLPPPPAR